MRTTDYPGVHALTIMLNATGSCSCEKSVATTPGKSEKSPPEQNPFTTA